MICSICKSHGATIHIQETFDKNTIRERYICKRCACKLDLFEECSLFSIDVQSLADLVDNQHISLSGSKEHHFDDEHTIECESCKTTLLDFLKTRHVGCTSCYGKFSSYIKVYFKDNINVSKHLGKKPSQDIDTILKRQHRLELEKKLQSLISKEDYEKAAIIRDYIAVLK